MTLWEIDIYPTDSQPDREAERVAAEAAELGVATDLRLKTARGFLLEGRLTPDQVLSIAEQLLADAVVEKTVVAQVGDPVLSSSENGHSQLVHVIPKPGVMDPVAQSTKKAIRDLGHPVTEVRTFSKYWLHPLDDQPLKKLCGRVLANDSVEQVVVGPLDFDRLDVGSDYAFERITVPIRQLDDPALEVLSREGQLYLTLVEMQTIQSHFANLDRDPSDVELETIAQTWSEHCSHKTLAGRIAYECDGKNWQFENMLKETIFAATDEIRKALGEDDWCVSVFEDNAGIVTFDEEFHVVFKVETHNHPSAFRTLRRREHRNRWRDSGPTRNGLGRQAHLQHQCVLLCGSQYARRAIAARSPSSSSHHERRRGWGTRLWQPNGHPTVNGAIYFDQRYLGNPLVYCGNVGILPANKTKKCPRAGDHIVAIGGRTGRDGIHGATFSSAELTSESESVSGGAVQIGNAITEKMLLDVLLKARDAGLYHAVTDCGAGGFSSAVGEMGEEIGAEVWLDRVPLKYEGLSYTEIWISEAQERMVLAVPPEHWKTFAALCESEGVEATILGTFVETGRLRLLYNDQQVADLSMEFLHEGRPPVVRQAIYEIPTHQPVEAELLKATENESHWDDVLKKILGSLNVASKEWVIRQYDHEVQGGSVVKPLVGIDNDGPSDAAVVRPRLDSHRGLAISCGMNPLYGDLDTYHMAASGIDEAVRNCIAVGADPKRIAILDNFCWGYTDRPETLGTLVRAALACYDVAKELQTPFISGKDSLNNEFSYLDEQGKKQTISIPSTLLISAMGQIADVRKCVTMDFKQAGNRLFLVGTTKQELGGSHFCVVQGASTRGNVPQVDAASASMTFAGMHKAIFHGLVRSCHDLSEGGLAVAVSEMAFAGGLGATIALGEVSHSVAKDALCDAVLLFSESNTRFLCEVSPDHVDEFTSCFAANEIACSNIGTTNESGMVEFRSIQSDSPCIQSNIDELKSAWQTPLAWE